MPSDPDLLAAGLLSHGFRLADGLGTGWQVWRRIGREDRWLRADGRIVLRGPGFEDLDLGTDGSYHALLRKCGALWLRTRERNAALRQPAQGKLALDADSILDQL